MSVPSPSHNIERVLTNSTSECGRTHDILYVNLLVCAVEDLQCDVCGPAYGKLRGCEGWEVVVLWSEARSAVRQRGNAAMR